MADIIVDSEFRKKQADGSYKIYHPFTKAKNVKLANGQDVESSLREKATNVTNIVTLKSSAWINNTQTINLLTIKSNSLLWVTPTPKSLRAYSESMVYASTQTNGAITFICEDIPSVDLDVIIVNGGDV